MSNLARSVVEPRTSGADNDVFSLYVRLVAGRLGLYSWSGNTKDFSQLPARRSAQPEVRRAKCVCVVRLVCPLTAFNHS